MIAASSLLWPASHSGVASPAATARPHVIMLGIDSLRLDELRRFGGKADTPNLDSSSQGDVFSDVTTPLARTFASWVAILTGRSPVVTGARYNLTPRTWSPPIRRSQTSCGAGYRTVYSTDEVRFANIDESYGFDEVITPPIGASDFLIGTYNELPLPSVVINTRLGQWPVPVLLRQPGRRTSSNRRPISRDWSGSSFDKPTMLIVAPDSRTLAVLRGRHAIWRIQAQEADDRPMYRVGLHTADSMFGESSRCSSARVPCRTPWSSCFRTTARRWAAADSFLKHLRSRASGRRSKELDRPRPERAVTHAVQGAARVPHLWA